MAARNRPRAGQLKDEIDEERSLWNQIRADGRRFDQLMVSVNISSRGCFHVSASKTTIWETTAGISISLTDVYSAN
jgi:hypothetical protein